MAPPPTPPPPPTHTRAYDVLVVGGGNAGLTAALSAHESGARSIALLECAPHSERGGNSRFAGAIFRVVHNGLPDIAPLLYPSEQNKADLARCRIKPYSWAAYEADMLRTTKGQCDRDQMEVMFEHSYETVKWMRDRGVKWQLTLGKFFDEDAIAKGGMFDLNGGGCLMAQNEGEGLTDDLWAAVEACEDPKIDVFYSSPVCDLLADGDTITGVRTRQRDGFVEFKGQVILACGGFEASARLRRQYLGEGWDMVVVRGTRFNTGTMLEKAIAADAGSVGHWGGCHASPQDLGAPRVGDLSVSDRMSRYSYPFSVMVNLEGRRFMDEGENVFGLTYAKTGAAIGRQMDATAFQVFDQKTLYLLEPRYSSVKVKWEANSFEELGQKMGVNVREFVKTMEEFNAATSPGEFSPFRLDGLSTGHQLAVPKTNWALPLDKPPYVAYGVTCGMTSFPFVSCSFIFVGLSQWQQESRSPTLV
jgi:tricarballylate dehydrogenase